jgi:hypothetical protein
VEFYVHAPVVCHHLLRYKIQDTKYNRAEQCFTLWFGKITTDRHTLAQVKEVRPRTGPERPQRGRVRYSSTLSLTSAQDEDGWSTPRPGRFTPVKETRYSLYRGLSGIQGRSGRDSKPRTVQLVASRYSDWAILAHQLTCYKIINLH